ncbi:hypothetical protein CHUAL_010897 [Chamberlinius hualienensis]
MDKEKQTVIIIGYIPFLVLILWTLNCKSHVHADPQHVLRSQPTFHLLQPPTHPHMHQQAMIPSIFSINQQQLRNRPPIVPAPIYNRYVMTSHNNNNQNHNMAVMNPVQPHRFNGDVDEEDRFSIRVLEPPGSPIIGGHPAPHQRPQQFGYLVNMPKQVPAAPMVPMTFPQSFNLPAPRPPIGNANQPIRTFIQQQQNQPISNLPIQRPIQQAVLRNNFGQHWQQSNRPLSPPNLNNERPAQQPVQVQSPVQDQPDININLQPPVETFGSRIKKPSTSVSHQQHRLNGPSNQPNRETHPNYGIKSDQRVTVNPNQVTTTRRPVRLFHQVQSQYSNPQLAFQIPAQPSEQISSQQYFHNQNLHIQSQQQLPNRGNQLIDLGLKNLPLVRHQLHANIEQRPKLQEPTINPPHRLRSPPSRQRLPRPPKPPEPSPPQTFLGRLVHAVVPEIKKIITAFQGSTESPKPLHQRPLPPPRLPHQFPSPHLTRPIQTSPQRLRSQLPHHLSSQMSQQFSHLLPQMSQQFSQHISPQTSEQFSQPISQQFSQPISQQFLQQMPQQFPQQMSQQFSSQISQQFSPQMSQQLQSQLSQLMQAPPKLLIEQSRHFPQHFPHRLPPQPPAEQSQQFPPQISIKPPNSSPVPHIRLDQQHKHINLQNYSNDTKIIVQIPTTVQKLQAMLNKAKLKQDVPINFTLRAVGQLQRSPIQQDIQSAQLNHLHGKSLVEPIQTSVITTTITTQVPEQISLQSSNTNDRILTRDDVTDVSLFSTKMPPKSLGGIPYAIAYFPPDNGKMFLKQLGDSNSKLTITLKIWRQ